MIIDIKWTPSHCVSGKFLFDIPEGTGVTNSLMIGRDWMPFSSVSPPDYASDLSKLKVNSKVPLPITVFAYPR